MLERRRALRTVYVLTVLLALSLGGSGYGLAAFPERPITIIAPAAAGGGTDLTARTLGRLAEAALGVSVVVTNMPGGGNAIGITAGYQAKPDGHTLVLGQVETVLLPLMGRVTWKAEEFTPVMGVNRASAALTVRADSRWTTVKDFVEHARANPDALKVGGSAPGTIWHLAAGGFARAANIKLNVIPYSGGAAPAIMDLLGGHVDAITVSAAEVAGHVAAGRLRTLAIMRTTRDSRFPAMPTMREQGYEAVFATWWALMAPPGTPASVIKRLHGAFKTAWDSAEFQEFMNRQGFEPMYVPPAAFRNFVDGESKKFRPVLSDLGLLGK